MPKLSWTRKILPLLGYAAFFVFCFVVFAYWAFPYDRLRDFAVQQLKAREADKRGDRDRFELEIGDLGPSGFLGVVARDVAYTKHPAGEGAEPGTLRVDELSVSPALLTLLFGGQAASFEAEAGGGELEGSFSADDDETELDTELSQLDLGKLGLGDYLGIPLTGRATGTVDLHLPADAAESAGAIKLVIENLTIGDGKAKVKVPGMRDGFTIERLDAGKLEVDVQIDEGTATINSFKADGDDILIDGSGTIRLASPMGRSRLNLTLSLKFSSAYKERDAKTKALFELMGFRPEIKRATAQDGTLRFQIAGTVSVPQARPAGKAPARPGP